ncbi:tripartite motif-containing protein 5-like isoform X1 [Equus przewalskii]|uniref:Tripartite motif-containing protein 5-like isoform X1 n=1 Tax=Equus przewalskii TaxID=9798 RepID=A0ABM4PT49_EQUPR
MASGILVDIKEEVTCPICLDLLPEPLSLDCGHSFCKACITSNNKESKIGQEGESSCPVCRIPYQLGNLRHNRHVANIVERLRKVKLRPEEEQKRDLCVCHEEKLLLFCKEDGKVICWLCERSQEHRGHHTFLMEEIAQEYQEKLQIVLERLREKRVEAEELVADVRKERTSWKNQIQNERQSVQAEFNQMRGILDCEEQKELLKLKNEEGDILYNLAESENELVQQSLLVRTLISDVEHRLQGSTLEMLQVRLEKKPQHLRFRKNEDKFPSPLYCCTLSDGETRVPFVLQYAFPATITEVIGIMECMDNKGKSKFINLSSIVQKFDLGEETCCVQWYSIGLCYLESVSSMYPLPLYHPA